MADVLVAELKRGDRVVLSCEKARRPGSRPARYVGMMDQVAFFLIQSSHCVDVHMAVKVGTDGTLTDNEGRAITVKRDEHREIHG